VVFLIAKPKYHTYGVTVPSRLPEEEQEKVAEYLGGSVACPGKEAEALGLNLEQGRYSMICFIPVGLTPDVRKEDADKLGPPHCVHSLIW